VNAAKSEISMDDGGGIFRDLHWALSVDALLIR